MEREHEHPEFEETNSGTIEGLHPDHERLPQRVEPEDHLTEAEEDADDPAIG